MADEFDSIVDDVARQMTSTPVDVNLTRRVAARIDHVATSHRAIWARPVLLAPLAAVCALVIAVVVSRNTHVDVERAAPRAASLTPATSRQAPTAGVPKPLNKEAGPPLTLRPIDVEPMDVEAMDIKTLDVPPMVSAEHIEIDPIAIARIEIAPMP